MTSRRFDTIPRHKSGKARIATEPRPGNNRAVCTATEERSDLRHELVDLDCALALDGDGLKLFGLDLDVLCPSLRVQQ